MSFLQSWLLLGLPLALLPIIIHLINQWRFQTKHWGAMMFLLAANRMDRGYAKIRQWLILAMRVLAIAGLIFAISRPLASGLLGWSSGGKPDTTIILIDRSPSMQERSAGTETKLATGLRQMGSALGTLGSDRWLLVESGLSKPREFASLESLIDSPETSAASSTADLPKMLQATAEYLQTNRPGPTEVWICSDLRASDWKADAGGWNAIRDAFQQFPQSVRFSLLAYPSEDSSNIAVRVSDVRKLKTPEGNSVQLSIHVNGDVPIDGKRTVALQIELDGARTELAIEMVGRQYDLRNHIVPIGSAVQRGWGRVSIPADANNADNEFYFIFDDAPPRKTVLVTDAPPATRALEIAAGIAPDANTTATVEVTAPEQFDSLALDGASLLLWHAPLPSSQLAGAISEYVQRGGQVIFFPPDSLASGMTQVAGSAYAGVRWTKWESHDDKLMVENWRSDQDLLAATRSGAALPVGQLSILGHAKLEGEVSKLATLTGGDPLIARIPTDKGGVYFCSASPSATNSTLATNGVVLFAAIQRAIERGSAALGNAIWRAAGEIEDSTESWRRVAGGNETFSTEFGFQSGIYESTDRLWAVNRPLGEDEVTIVGATEVERLFDGLDFTRVDDEAGNLTSIVREVWRAFLITMIVAMLVEAVLCLPRRATRQSPSKSLAG